MSEHQSSYRQSMKATSIFGGVQMINIVVLIIRSKFIAVLLGAAGMGIADLLNTTYLLISNLTNFGLGVSAVKNVAEANGSENINRLSVISVVLRRWVWVTGLFGMIVTIATAPLLSRLTFGNSNYTFPFIWISISLLLSQLSSGQIILLQGMRKLKYLAKANLAGSILSLIIAIPLYYLFGIKGIVPAIILTSCITLSCSWYYGRKIEVPKVKVSKVRTIAEGKDMLKMGFMISLSGLITLGASYILRIYISRYGGVEQVGLYTAGFAIINTYVGLIFTAMSTDYYPRLSAVAINNDLCKKAVNQQAEIALLILAPIIMFFLVFIQWLVIILYSDKFIAVNTMIHWAALGMLFKAASWSIAFILLAKGASKLFFWNELIGNLYVLAFNVLGYHYWGLTGLGISFMIGYVVYLIQVFVLCRIKYQFNFDRAFIRIFCIQFLLALSCFLIVKLISNPISYFIGMFLITISTWYSYIELNKRLGIAEMIANFRSNHKKDQLL